MACRLKKIIQLNEAISYINIRILNGDSDITTLCKYSWSTDSVCWTNWASIDMYKRICPNLDADFYLRVLVDNPFDNVMLGESYTKCYSVCLDSSMNFLSNFCEDPNLFQPYKNLDCALLLQQQLADSVVCMFGIPVYYFRVNPNEEATDFTFKEHYLHHIESVKQLKLMIADGAMPSSNPKLTEFDFDWEVDWETELSKTQFAQAFGDTAYPKTGDFLYIPLMKRMWEVSAAYDEKKEGLMWRSTTWKLALVKYTESTNVDSSEYDDMIDGLIQHYENVFSEIEHNEQERETGATPLSAPSFAATNLFDIFMEDAVRKQYTKQDTTIIDKTYNHKSLVVARNLYKFKNENGCVTYQKPICGDSGTLMFIIETPGTLMNKIERDIINFGNVQVTMKYREKEKDFLITFGELEQILLPFKSYMIMIKWNRASYSTELNVYEYKHPADMPVYKVRPEMYWFDYENPVCELIGIYNNDYDIRKEMECKIHSYPLFITNIKYYNKALDKQEAMKESIKYTTQHDNCVINDLARKISSGHGYAVR
jgi:hypothetical protein